MDRLIDLCTTALTTGVWTVSVWALIIVWTYYFGEKPSLRR